MSAQSNGHRPSPARRGLGLAGSLAFCRGVAGRLRRRPLATRPLELVTLRPARPVLLSHNTTRFRFAPRIELSFARGALAEPGPAAERATSPNGTIQSSPALKSHRIRTADQVRPLHGTRPIPHRILTRRERVEPSPTAGPAAVLQANAAADASGPASVPSLSPAPLVVVRSPAAAAETGHPAGPGTPPDRAQIEPRDRGWGPLTPAAPPAPHDLDRFTDQVIDAINRRLIAYRERTGRV
jgi:hypothetical protein